jgi:hypothetical protein
MSTQARKIHGRDLEAMRPALEAGGWRYVGPLANNLNVHRFIRDGGAPSGDGHTIAPTDTYIKLRGHMP